MTYIFLNDSWCILCGLDVKGIRSRSWYLNYSLHITPGFTFLLINLPTAQDLVIPMTCHRTLFWQEYYTDQQRWSSQQTDLSPPSPIAIYAECSVTWHLLSCVQPEKELRGLGRRHQEPWSLSSTISVGQLTVFCKSGRMSLEMSRSCIHCSVQLVIAFLL